MDDDGGPQEQGTGAIDPGSFLNRNLAVDVHENYLPHWQQGSTFLFVTWRLADALPRAKLNEWAEEKAIWLRFHPCPWDVRTQAAYHERFSGRIDRWLDKGSGSAILRNERYANVVAAALRHFDGDRYELVTFVIMPNHVHVLFRPIGSHRLSATVKSWKGFSAREINRMRGESGPLWQEDYWDRVVRNPTDFTRCILYIKENPTKASLRPGQFYFHETERSRGLPAPIV